MTSRNTDYAKNYFRHHTLTKLHGESNYDVLSRLRNKIKANLTGITSDLGGGNNIHLYLGPTTVQYYSIPNTTYNWTCFPSAVAPAGATQHEIVTLRDNWKKDLLELYKKMLWWERP